jgi:hypothetical protein
MEPRSQRGSFALGKLRLKKVALFLTLIYTFLYQQEVADADI